MATMTRRTNGDRFVLLLFMLPLAAQQIITCLGFIISSPSSPQRSMMVKKRNRHTIIFQSSSEQPSEPSSEQPSEYIPGSHEELLYALGINLGRQLGDIRPLVTDTSELNNLAKGILDVMLGRIDETTQAQLLVRRKDNINDLLITRSNELKSKLMEAGKSMIEEMKKVEDAYVLPSGVVIHPLVPGPSGTFGVGGSRPTAASTVKVHYHGTLPDGTTFDTTSGGDPVSFALGQVIPGMKEALLKISEGETVMVGIPPEAGYGDEGSQDGRVPGGATLFFKIQLLEVLSAGIGGSPKLLGADGKPMGSSSGSGSGLLGVDGKPLTS